MTRYGATVVFKEGLSRKQAEQALRTLDGLVEPGGKFDFEKRAFVENTNAGQLLNSFNDAHGGPVWYIP